MKFISKTEAYTYAVFWLTQLLKRYPQAKKTIQTSIDQIKVAFNNHEQSPTQVTCSLHPLFSLLDKVDQSKLASLVALIENSPYQHETLQEKFENPLARRAESEVALALLLAPTPAMMASVKRVSQQIMPLLLQANNTNKKNVVSFLKYLNSKNHAISCGSFPHVPTLDEVMAVLQKNDAQTLPEIMHIHYKFAQLLFKFTPVTNSPLRAPVGEFANIIEKIWPYNFMPELFFCDGVNQDNKEGEYFRAYISDVLMYQSLLYTAENGRGRSGALDLTRSNEFGLMLSDQGHYALGLPTDTVSWVPDCKGQKANFDSAYVLDQIENSGVYVSGFSGMASLFLGQMEITTNFENEELKKNYLAAVAAYIVGGGFHSLHEVIAPAEYALKLVPGYHVSIPDKNMRALPPNYEVYFEQQSHIDPQFKDRIQNAWHRYLAFFKDFYLTFAPHLLSIDAQIGVTGHSVSPHALFAPAKDSRETVTGPTAKEEETNCEIGLRISNG